MRLSWVQVPSPTLPQVIRPAQNTRPSFAGLFFIGHHNKDMAIYSKNKYSPIQAWILASRPKTLPAAAAPVLLAAGVAFYEGVFVLWVVLLALATALLLQIGANFANDLFDFQKGADTEKRLGPLRVTQSGLLSPTQVATGMTIVFALAAVLGLILYFRVGWPILALGFASILAALAYTGGPLPYGYFGFGEIFVFIFFGFAAVCGTYYAQAGFVSKLAVWSSIPMGSLSTAILVVNNLRDIPTDSQAGKITLAVRFGPHFARILYDFLLATAYLTPVLLIFTGNAPVWILLAHLSLFLILPVRKLVHQASGLKLNKALAGTGQTELLFAVFYSVGLLIAS